MTVKSGKFGTVNGQSTIRNWNVNVTQAVQAYKASNTRGGTGRRPGARDWTGSFAKYGAIPLIMPGEPFDFIGFTGPDAPLGSGPFTGPRYAGPSIVEGITITWSWGDSAILNSTYNYAGNGKLTVTDDGAEVVDATAPDVPIPCGTKITYGADVEWENLLSATLNITAQNQAYVNSSTIFDGECWTKRDGGPIDWTLAVVEQNDAGLPAGLAIGSDVAFKLYVNDTDFWLLEYGHVIDHTGLTIDRESGAIIQRTVNIGMNVHNGASYGQIVLPGESTPWFDATAA